MRVEPTWAVHMLYQMMVVPVSKRARISMCCSVPSFQVTLLAPHLKTTADDMLHIPMY